MQLIALIGRLGFDGNSDWKSFALWLRIANPEQRGGLQWRIEFITHKFVL